MIDNILVIAISAGSLMLAFYLLSLLYLLFLLIRESIYEKEVHRHSLDNLLLAIFLGPYGLNKVQTTKFGIEMDKSEKRNGIIFTLLTVLALSYIILPKIGRGNEIAGSLFENEKYIGYHYATLAELDEDYVQVSVEVFGIAEIEKDGNTRWINNIYIDNYGTFHAFSADPVEVFKAPIVISDIDYKNYKVRILESKPELKKYEELYTKVASVTDYNSDDGSRQDILVRMKSQDKTIRLVRDKTHIFEEDAVRVYSKYGMIGYISKELAPLIASELDNGGIVKATVSEITGGDEGKYYGCNLHIQFYRTVEKENYRPSPDSDGRY